MSLAVSDAVHASGLNVRTGNAKRRICFVITSLYGGGAERVVLNIIKTLGKERFLTELVTMESVNHYKGEAVAADSCISFNKKGPFDYFRLALKLRSHVARTKPDIVISFLDYANIISLMAVMIFGRGKKFKWITAVRNNPFKIHRYSKLGKLQQLLLRAAYRKSDHVNTNSVQVAEQLTQQWGIPSGCVSTIQNPVALAKIRRASEERIRHPFFDNPELQVLISVGRLTAQKRFDRLIRVFHGVHRVKPHTRLIIVGQGELQNDLENMISDLSLNQSVSLVGFQQNPYAWIRRAHLFVLSSDYEGLPNVVLEAMACGVPVVSTDCPFGPNEIIKDGENGLLVSLENDLEFERTVVQLLGNEKVRQDLARSASVYIEQHSLDRIMPLYEELFANNGI